MFRFILVNILVLVVVVFFTQNSLIYYIEQRFHSTFGLDEFLRGSAFSKGAEIFRAFGDFVDTSAKVVLSDKSKDSQETEHKASVLAVENKEIAKQENLELDIQKDEQKALEFALELDNKTAQKQESTENIAPNITINIRNEKSANNAENIDENITNVDLPSDKIRLKQGDSVLITGDSMMQYIGITARQKYPKLGLKVLDLSKQSTGLLDKKGHNWAQVIKDNLAQDRNIKLIVMLLGANDPWGRSINGRFFDIGTPEWGEFYASRVDEIYQIAKARRVKVLWLSLPCMQKEGFGKKTEILNEIYKNISEKNAGAFINTSEYLCRNNAYLTHINIEGKRSKIRQDDGIHINKAGSELLANEILKRIEIE